MNTEQEVLFRGMHFLNLILKARQIGFTTFIQIFILDAAVFNENIHAGIIAHTRDDAEAFFREKIKYAYDGLPEQIKVWNPAEESSARVLSFRNKSIIRVGTSLRSGTYQYLHVSEYGKLCAKFPDKAIEVRTGALNTIHAGQVAFIESTAEGTSGHFFDMCAEAQEMQRRGIELTPLDFKFFFFAWWKHPTYKLDPEGVEIGQNYVEYFKALLEQEGVKLDTWQKAWYVKKAAQQGEHMKREFPSTPKEAFEAAIEGAYYGGLMAKADIQSRITRVPYDPKLPVDSWWDLGIGDYTSIWLSQATRFERRFIGYYENEGEALGHYAQWLSEWKADRQDVVWGRHLVPHDAEVRSLNDGDTRSEKLRDLGLNVHVMERHLVADGIEACRQLIPTSFWDAEACSVGIDHLRFYSKEWDEKRGVYRTSPRHDIHSNGADAFRTGAMDKHGVRGHRDYKSRRISIV
jgi:hypothetical protein